MIINSFDVRPKALCGDNKLFSFEANNIVSMICYRSATNESFVVRFSLEDMDRVKQLDKWKVEKGSNKLYANKGTVNTYLHRLIYEVVKEKKYLQRMATILIVERKIYV